MGRIEGGGGGSSVNIGIVPMAYYDSYALAGSNYVATITSPGGEDQLSYVGTNSTVDPGFSSTTVIASLWVFNDGIDPIGTTPLTSMVATDALPRLAITKGDYTGSGSPQVTVGIGSGIITSAFDPSLITSLADLLSLTTTTGGFLSITGVSQNSFGTGEATASESNLYRNINVSSDVYGFVTTFAYSGFNNINSTSFTVTLGNKNIRVIV